MEPLLKEDIHALIEPRTGPCISVYIPTERASVETLQNPIRFKNQIREVENRLTGFSLRPAAARELLEPLRALVDDYDFWQHQEDGLALFRAADYERHFRLPSKFDELALVSGRFHVKPLLSLLAWNSRFYVLALSQNSVRLLECTGYRAAEVELPETVPASFAEFQGVAEPRVQMNVWMASQGSAGQVVFGQGSGDEEKEALGRYFRAIDRGVCDVLREQRAPLVLAGVEYLFPIYKSVSAYAGIAPEGIPGAVDEVRPGELHRKALAVAQPLFTAAADRAAAEYRRRQPEGRATGGLEEALRAAHSGRVEALFVPLGVQRWGRFDAATGKVELHPREVAGDEDLLDLASIQTFLGGGTVFPVAAESMPGGAPVAAVLRY